MADLPVHIIIIGKLLVPEWKLFAYDDEDWELQKPFAYYTNDRYLPKILKDIGVVPSISEVRRNKPQYMITLDKPDYLELKWGNHPLWIGVGVDEKDLIEYFDYDAFQKNNLLNT